MKRSKEKEKKGIYASLEGCDKQTRLKKDLLYDRSTLS